MVSRQAGIVRVMRIALAAAAGNSGPLIALALLGPGARRSRLPGLLAVLMRSAGSADALARGTLGNGNTLVSDAAGSPG